MSYLRRLLVEGPSATEEEIPLSVVPQEAAYVQGPTSGRLAWGKSWRTAGADEDVIVASARCDFGHREAEGARQTCSSAAELEQGEGLARNRPLMKRSAFSSSQCRPQHAYGGGMISVEA